MVGSSTYNVLGNTKMQTNWCNNAHEGLKPLLFVWYIASLEFSHCMNINDKYPLLYIVRTIKMWHDNDNAYTFGLELNTLKPTYEGVYIFYMYIHV